jgi:hypothetical protein
MNIKDFIYFDLDKAMSLLSQLDGKVITDIQEQVDNEKDERNIRQYDLKLFKPEFGGVETSKNSLLTTGVAHHSIFNLLETKLNEFGLLTKITADTDLGDDKDELFNLLQDKYYVIAEGYVNFEDFKKIEFILNNFNDISKFISQCAFSGVEESDEYKSALTSYQEQRDTAEKIKDKNQRRYQLKQISSAEEEFRKKLVDSAGVETMDDWLVEGINLFINTFLKDKNMIRVFPFEERPENHFIANLKSECYIDDNIENIINAYGTKPNVKLTIFGLITSLPSSNGLSFNALDEYTNLTDDMSQKIVLEKAFREIFTGMEEVEKYVKFARYPNVTLYPIAVYRDIKIKEMPKAGD